MKYFDVNKARKDGHSDEEIRVYMQKNGLQPLSQKTAPQQQSGMDINTVFNSQEPPEKKKGFIQSLTEPVTNYLGFVGEAGAQGIRYLTDPTFRKAIHDPESLTPEEIEKVNKRQTYFIEPEKIKDRETVVKTGAKRTAGAAAYAVPVGGSLTGAALKGAVAGGLLGFAEDEDEFLNTEDIRAGATGGAIGGSLAYGAGKLINAGGKLFNKGKNAISKKGAEAFTKSTPSKFQKAVEEHGIDINEIAQKYIPANSTYDDIVGTAAQRGKGGLLKETLKVAEKQIDDVIKSAGSTTKIASDDVVKALKLERKLLNNKLGAESQRKALDKIIKEAEKKYAKGITPKQALKILRTANKEFGKSIVQTEKGAIASSAQKVEANALKRVLKGLFPEIDDALRTQEEILTLRPILNQARAKGEVGGFRLSRIDLTKPLAIFDPILNSPKVASTIAQTGGGKAFNLGAKSSALEFAGRATGAKVATLEPSTTTGMQFSGGQTAFGGEEQKDYQPITGNTVEQHMRALSMAQRAGDTKAAKAIKQQLQLEQEYQKSVTGTGQVKGVERIKLEGLAKSGLQAVDDIFNLYSQDPSVLTKQKIPGQWLSRKYDNANFRAADAILRLRTGAQAPDSEIRRYVNSYMPAFGDSEEVVQFKLGRLAEDLMQYLNTSSQNTIVPDNSLQFQSGVAAF